MSVAHAAPSTGSLLTSRSSLIRAAESLGVPETVTIVDLWSVDQRWQDHLNAARGASHTVLLSSIGVDIGASPYLQVLAGREEAARRALSAPTTLRLAPVVEDLSVYASPLSADDTIFHAYSEDSVAWLSANDVLHFAAQVGDHPGALGGTFDLFGPAHNSATGLLGSWAERIGSTSTFAAVPPQVLVQQLEPVFGADTAAAVVGHQQWCGSGLTPTGADMLKGSALAQALSHPTPWHDALGRMINSIPTSKENQR